MTARSWKRLSWWIAALALVAALAAPGKSDTPVDLEERARETGGMVLASR